MLSIGLMHKILFVLNEVINGDRRSSFCQASKLKVGNGVTISLSNRHWIVSIKTSYKVSNGYKSYHTSGEVVVIRGLKPILYLKIEAEIFEAVQTTKAKNSF